MEDLRRCWKVPYIVYFCNLFESKLDLVDLRIDEFEEAIIDDCGCERNIVVIHLLQKLLKAFVNRSIDLTNFETILLGVLKKYNAEQLFLQAKEENQWSELSMLTKLDILYTLCEYRLQLADTELKINEYEPSDLRIEPIGVDAAGNTLWYFGDLRLYEERQPGKEKEKKKEPDNNSNSNSKKKSSSSSSSSSKKKSSSNSNAKSSDRAAVAQPSKSETTVNNKMNTRAKSQPATPVVSTPGLNRSTRSSRRREEAAAATTATVENTSVLTTTTPTKSAAVDNIVRTRSSDRLLRSPRKEDKTVIKREEKEDEDMKIDVVKEESTNQTQQEEEEEKVENEEPTKTEPQVKKEEEVEEKSDDQTEKTAPPPPPPPPPQRPLIEEKEEYKQELKNWSCICLTLEDWTKVADAYKKSKKKADQEIAKLLEENYLPEMPALFQKAERERMHRLLAMAPKRQSQRLQVKQQTTTTTTTNDSSSANGSQMPKSGSGLPGSYVDYFSDYDDEDGPIRVNTSSMSSFSSATALDEQGEKQRRDEIARQREERLKQRLMRREMANYEGILIEDETSQASMVSRSSSTHNASDFNITNYILMHKVLSKVLACKFAWPFKNAVSEDDAPDYNTIIQVRIKF